MAGAQPASQKPAAIALVDGADAVQWQKWVQETGWKVIAPQGAPSANSDQRVLALAAQVEAEIKAGSVDPARIYLAGRGDAAAMVFFTISRVPDLWAAGAAIGGSPKPAIDSGRIFAANFTNVPVLWVSGEEDRPLAERLKAANLNLEWQSAAQGGSATAVIQWLGRHQRPAFPPDVDCETNSPQFARCYWVQLTKFDAAERNDVLPASRIAGGSGASLDLGGFGFKLDDAGPGVLVGYLADKYNGPLKLNDRIVALDGKPLENAKQYQAVMEKMTEERSVVVTVQRGKERIRLETRVVLPARDAGVTARVHAQYLPAEKEIQIVSRTVTEMRVTVPAEWVPASLSWNGLTLESIKEPGCWTLSMQKEILHAEKCK